MFALRHKKTGKLMSVYASSNEGSDCCVSVRYSFTIGGSPWVVNNRSTAETAMNTSEAWYNADYESPQNRYIGQLEIVELTVKE